MSIREIMIFRVYVNSIDEWFVEKLFIEILLVNQWRSRLVII